MPVVMARDECNRSLKRLARVFCVHVFVRVQLQSLYADKLKTPAHAPFVRLLMWWLEYFTG